MRRVEALTPVLDSNADVLLAESGMNGYVVL